MTESIKIEGTVENRNQEENDVWERKLSDLIAYSRFRVFYLRKKLERISEENANDEMIATFRAVSKRIMENPSFYLDQVGENPMDKDYDEFSDRLCLEIYPDIFIKKADKDQKIA